MSASPLARPLRKTPASPGVFCCHPSGKCCQGLGAGVSAGQWAEQRRRHAVSTPVAVAAAHLHPDQTDGMVGLAEIADPGDGISDSVINGVVLTVELTVGLAAAVEEAVAALDGLRGLAISNRGSNYLRIRSSRSNTLASSKGTWLYRAERFDVSLLGGLWPGARKGYCS